MLIEEPTTLADGNIWRFSRFLGYLAFLLWGCKFSCAWGQVLCNIGWRLVPLVRVGQKCSLTFCLCFTWVWLVLFQKQSFSSTPGLKSVTNESRKLKQTCFVKHKCIVVAFRWNNMHEYWVYLMSCIFWCISLIRWALQRPLCCCCYVIDYSFRSSSCYNRPLFQNNRPLFQK